MIYKIWPLLLLTGCYTVLINPYNSKTEVTKKEEVIHFVMHYERLTRYVLEEIPKFADIVLYRDNEFNFKRM